MSTVTRSRPDPDPDPELARTRAVTRAFEEAGAVSPAAARPLDQVLGGVALDGVALDAAAVLPLVARGGVREASPGRYYLHADAEHARRRRLVRLALLVAVSVLPALLALSLVRG